MQHHTRLTSLLENKLNRLDTSFNRYLYQQMDWELPLIILTGSRGAGKTTMLLQYLKELEKPFEEAFYVSLDDPFFETERLWEFGTRFYQNGGRLLLLDEVHKYGHWSKDLKYLHDNFDDLRVVATGSSILDLRKGDADLSRRAAFYHLHGLSFREYLNVTQKTDFPVYALTEILEDEGGLSARITDRINPLPHFKKYLRSGHYPLFLQREEQYLERLANTINLIIETDIPAFEKVDYQTVKGLKKLLYVLSESVPFKPNISKLSERIGTSRQLLLKMLDLMARADLLLLLKTEAKGVGYLAKPEKVFLHNPNLYFALADFEPKAGQLRETFFISQLTVHHHVTAPKAGDFMVNNKWVFEVGGASKTRDQIAGVPNAFVAADDIKFGSDSRIPLWLFGFLY